jgi:hypothetical protein
MRRLFAAQALVLVGAFIFGVALSNAGAMGAGATTHGSKAAFCAANDSIDRASANVNSAAAFLAVLKTHTHDLTIMKENAPAGGLGQLARQLVNDALAAVSSNSVTELNNLPDGGAVDTYCGVDGNGKPLPKYFGTGKTTAFCSTFLPIYQAVGNATDSAGVLAALTANQAQISQLASELPTLPTSIKAEATATVDKAQAAITTQTMTQGNGNGPATDVALYCGENS